MSRSVLREVNSILEQFEQEAIRRVGHNTTKRGWGRDDEFLEGSK